MSTFGILPDDAIRTAVDCGDITIDPYNPAQLNPVSYDLTLGDGVSVYKRWVVYDEHYYDRGPKGLVPSRADTAGARNGSDLNRTSDYVIDVKDEPETASFKIDPKRGWILKPGIGYLMHTMERIKTTKYVPIIDGKSSMGRLFMLLHFTAGFGDPGFDGQYTLEVSVMHPLRVYAGIRIAQVRFHTIAGILAKPYQGNYTGEASRGAVASRAFKQFQK